LASSRRLLKSGGGWDSRGDSRDKVDTILRVPEAAFGQGNAEPVECGIQHLPGAVETVPAHDLPPPSIEITFLIEFKPFPRV
jgi:hypothetical protein